MAIDLNTIKKMPPKYKFVAVLVAFLLIGYLYWMLYLSEAVEKKSALSVKLTELQDKVKEKTKIASQIEKYKVEVAALQESYKIALQKLPDEREIPNLFHSVALAGKDAGVEFLSFEPKPSVPKVLEKETSAPVKVSGLMKPSDQRDQKQEEQKPAEDSKAAGGKKAAEPEPFYEEIPVAVTVVGTFQNTLYFFDKVAKLPRIINVSDVSMAGNKDAKGKINLITSSLIVKTYKFIDKKEKANNASEKTK
jgi:type IV pilus assembly protein PilO